MKVLVCSDSHAGIINIRRMLDMHPDAEAVFFLGDGIADFYALKNRYPAIAFIAVKGNWDTTYGDMYNARPTEEITLEGKRIFACHGHTYRVKDGLATLTQAARSRQADIVLFGHTHRRCEMYIPAEKEGERPLYIINPGAIGAKGYDTHSFCVLDIRENGVLASFGSIR